MKKVFPIIFLITVFISACADNSAANIETTNTPTPPPTATTTASVTSIATPTNTLTPTPINTPTPTSTHTVTPLPTNTPIPSPTNTPSALPTDTPTPTATLPPVEPTEVKPESMNQPAPTMRTVRVGLHGRNDRFFEELDYQLIRETKIETLKMMSLTDPSVFERIKRENPDIEFIVRLYDERLNEEGHPTPQEYVAKIIPLMDSLRPFVTKFEIGNEPNHVYRYEGWGSEDADAISFNAWFLEVYDLLKTAHPWAELGYPALATPDSFHRDKAWLALTREAINRADWLGVHCYWQQPPDQPGTMFDENRGLCFKYYHEQFPDKPLEITEFDNDNVIWEIPPNTPEEIARQYETYYQELFKYPYIRSASSFIMSSPDSRWDYFAWRTEADGFKPIVSTIGEMPRPSLVR